MANLVNSINLDKTVLPTIMSNIQLGNSLQAISIGQMAETGGGYRACAIEIRNYHRDLELTEPSQYLATGVCAIPPAPVIKPGHSEACLYHSTPIALSGSFGVLTYGIDYVTVDYQKSEILNRRNEGIRLALMWSVPMSGKTQHAVGVANGANACKDLYLKMQEGTGPWFSREEADVCVKYQTRAYNIPINVEATISNVNRAVWIINIQ